MKLSRFIAALRVLKLWVLSLALYLLFIAKYSIDRERKQMRDILNLFDSVLVEATLAAGEIPNWKNSAVANPKTGKLFTRPELFLDKIRTGSPFTLVNGGEVVIDPKLYRTAFAWIKTGPQGTITLTTTDGDTVKNTQLQKTIEFGSKSSETITVKPGDVFDTDPKQEIEDFGNDIGLVLNAGGFPASQMYKKISSSPALIKMGKIGDAVIYLSKQANQGKVPELPPNLSKDEIKAIELYASEYIGALGLVAGGVPFVRGSREQFEEFIGGALSDMIIFFPKASNNPLADSFSISNSSTGHAVKISSKAAGKGAPPSLGGMKLPNEVREKYPEAAKFLDAAQDPSLSSITQPFALMDYLNSIAPNKIPKPYRSMLPFDQNLVGAVANSIRTGKSLPRKIMANFEKQLSARIKDTDSPDGGKAWWATIQDTMRLINNDKVIPDFREALIESLGYNFIQLYTNIKNNKLVTEAFWPGKISGQVKLKTKGSASEQKGKMSIEISPGGEDFETPDKQSQEDMPRGANSKRDTAQVSTNALDTASQRRSRVQAAPNEKKLGTDQALGRKRQR